MQIAAGEAWSLASEEVAARYRGAPTAIAYRPIIEAPIPLLDRARLARQRAAARARPRQVARTFRAPRPA